MEDRPLLGPVDRLARKHGGAVLLDVGRIGERHQQPHRLVVDQVFRIVQKEITERDGEAVEAAGIVLEPLAEGNPGDRRPVRLQCRKGLNHR